MEYGRDAMKKYAPSVIRYLDNAAGEHIVSPPAELVPADTFTGTDISENVFSFYGESYRLQSDFDWEDNPGNPHWGHDLNRFGFLVLYNRNMPLKDKQAMLNLVFAWIEKSKTIDQKQSPYMYGNYLNISIRIENWWRFLYDINDDDDISIRKSTMCEIYLSVLYQILVLVKKIKHDYIGSNWVLIGLRAAFFVLLSTPSFPHRRILLKSISAILENAIEKQFLPDGVQNELSPHYHWVVVELINSINKMSSEAGIHIDAANSSKVQQLTKFLRAMILPDAGMISVGNSDYDYGPRIAKFIQSVKVEYENTENSTAHPQIDIFPHAGFAVVQDRRNRHTLMFNCSKNKTGHSHEDALSLWLTAFGENIIIDPGRYNYDYDKESMHSYLQSSLAHTTISIDGKSQLSSKDRAAMQYSPVLATQNGDIFLLKGEYSGGYKLLNGDFIHKRYITCDMPSGKWIITDELLGTGSHKIECRWQFSPGGWSLSPMLFQAQRGAVQVLLRFSSQWASYEVKEGATSPYCGWYSPGLNKIIPSPCLILSGEFELPFQAATVITANR